MRIRIVLAMFIGTFVQTAVPLPRGRGSFLVRTLRTLCRGLLDLRGDAACEVADPMSEPHSGSALCRALAPVISLAKPNHGPSKPIYHPGELRLTQLRFKWLDDVDGDTLEVDISRSARLIEAFESSVNLVHNMFQLSGA